MANKQAKLLPQYFAGCSAALGSFALGATIGWSSPVELAIKSGELGFTVTNNEFAWVGSLLTLGAAAVCMPIGYVIDIVGRKRTMLGLVPGFVLAWLLIIFAQSVMMLCVARFLLGMCGGAFCIIAPIYTTEIAETRIRGILGSLFQMLITMGVEYGFVVCSFFSIQYASAICGIVPLVMGALVLLLPESPTFFVIKGNTDNAAASLQWLRGPDYDIAPELAQIIEYNKLSRESRVPLKEALLKKTNVKALSFSVALMMFQQFSGINAILFYATAMFKMANPDVSETMSTILLGLMMMLATFGALFLIDRVGRRPLLIISAFFMCLCNLGTGFYFIRKDTGVNVQSLAILPVTCCCIYVIMFSLGFGAIPWLFMAEIFSENVKSVFGSLAGTINWGSAFLVTNLYPVISTSIGVGQTFCIFGIIIGCAVPFVLMLLPETKNKTFLEIQKLLGDDQN